MTELNVHHMQACDIHDPFCMHVDPLPPANQADNYWTHTHTHTQRDRVDSLCLSFISVTSANPMLKNTQKNYAYTEHVMTFSLSLFPKQITSIHIVTDIIDNAEIA